MGLQPRTWAKIATYLDNRSVGRLALTTFEPVHIGTVGEEQKAQEAGKAKYFGGVMAALGPALGAEVVRRLCDFLID